MTTPGAPNIKKFPLVFSSALQYWWQPPSEGGADVTEYELTVGPEVSTFRLPGGTTNWTVDGLTNNTFYSASIRATCNYPEWGPSAQFHDWQPGLPPSYGVEKTWARGNRFTNALISWRPPSILPSSPIYWYVIRSKSSDPNDPELSYTASGQTEVTTYITDMNSNSSYYFTVEAVNCSGYYGLVSTNIVGGVYSPLQVTGLQVWLDAQDYNSFTLIQSSITQWNDKSGNGRNAIPYYPLYTTYSSTILNNYPGVIMDSNRVMKYNEAAGTYRTNAFVFVVYQTYGTSTYNYLLHREQNLTNIGSPFIAADKLRRIGNGSAYTDITSPFNTGTINNLTLFQFNTSLSRYQEWINTSSIYYTTAAPSAFGDTAFETKIGSGTYTSAPYTGGMKMRVGEIITYNSNLTPFARQKTEGYLAWKWGFESKLASSHLFAAEPPYISTVFTPYLIPGLRLWYDGADPNDTGVPPVPGDTVSTWLDKSGFSNHAIAGVAATYIGASTFIPGYLLFDGITTNYTIPNTSFINNQQYMIFIVDQLSSYTTGTPHLLSGTGDVNANLLVRYTGTNPISFDYNYNGSVTTYSLTGYPNTSIHPGRLWSLIQTATNRQLYLNGTLVTNTSWTNLITSWVGAQIGAQGATNFYKGGINEIIAVAGVPNTETQQVTEGYLAWKWKLTGGLPSAHPYKSINPSQITQSFQPTFVQSLTLWLDAADDTTFQYSSGTLVSTWINKSRTGNDLNQTTVNAQPTREPYENLYTVSFTWNGSNPKWLRGSAINNYYPLTSRTIFIVGIASPVQHDSAGANSVHMLSDFSQNIAIYFRSSGYVGVYNTGISVETPYTINTLALFGYEYGGSGTFKPLNVRLNGGPATTRNSQQTTDGTPSLYLGRNSTTYYFQGKIMEVITYSNLISTGDRQNVEGYLAWKWGLQDQLLANHPCKLGPPSFKA
jgi:hypothetical protein